MAGYDRTTADVLRRIKRARLGHRITEHEYLTLKGQAQAGQPLAAAKGLAKLLSRAGQTKRAPTRAVTPMGAEGGHTST